MSKTGIVNVRMVITQEKILSNIDKVQKLINPNSKKQIVQLDEDSYFKDLIESIKTYLIEYPKKKNFPKDVYKAAYGLVEYATNQFEENTKQIEELIRQTVRNISNDFTEDIIDTLLIIGRAKNQSTQNYDDAIKLIHARISNLESNLHIEIDMERIEDRSKALSFIGIEVADALKVIPAPVENAETEGVEQQTVQTIQETEKIVIEPKAVETVKTMEVPEEAVVAAIQTQQEKEQANYMEETRVDVKPTLWQKIKNMKLVRAISCIFKMKVVIDIPTLPEGKGE